MSAHGDSDREVEAIMQEGRGSPVLSYGAGSEGSAGSLGASLGSSRSESAMLNCGASDRGDRPPSSYGSMRSDDALDDQPDDQDFRPPPSSIVTLSKRRVHRAESPETTFTEATNALTCKSVLPREGVFVNVPSRAADAEVMEEEEDDVVEVRGEEPEQGRPGDGGAEHQEELQETPLPPSPPPAPPSPPPHGQGLQYGPVHKELSLPFIFKNLQSVLSKLNATELMWFKRQVCQRHNEKVKAEQLLECDVLDTVDYLIERFRLGGATRVTTSALHMIGRRKHSEEIEEICKRILVRHELHESHRRHFDIVFEGVARPGEQAGLHRVFTELMLCEGGHRGVITDHEYLSNLSPAYGAPRRLCHYNDILRPYPEGSTERVRFVVVSGHPMIGASFCLYKLAQDWNKERANQDLHFLFYFKCRELQYHAEEKFSLLKLLSHFHHAIEPVHCMLNQPDSQGALVLDGFELQRPTVDWSAPPITDMRQVAPLKAVLASLLRGDLLPHMYIILTCRRHDLDAVPHYLIDRHFEVRGYSPLQREEYFLKHYDRDLTVGQRVCEKAKSQPTVYHMSQLPVFAWVTAFLFERRCVRSASWAHRHGHETLLYVHVVMLMVNRWFERYRGSQNDNLRWQEHDKAMMMRLGRFAWRSVEARRTCFTAHELKEHDLNATHLTQIGIMAVELPEWQRGPRAGEGGPEGGLCLTAPCNRPISYAFTHLSLQEFMAAWYVYLAFRNDGRNVFEQQLVSSVVAVLVRERNIMDLYRPAVERALASRDGHLDLVLRFLFGLAMDSTEDNLRGTMLPHRHPSPRGLDDAKRFLQKKIQDFANPANANANAANVHPDRINNLKRCLEEITELVEDIY
ncbi:hypothetical protein ACEWY4_008406 [Coilia grayii]|uniref:Pyrin domain-containing protein n=1 Tax=Coilia grayii TaxID=363190 RepID=A0ABD1KBG8_9TELE